MNDDIIKNIANDLNIKEGQVKNTLSLLSEGATIPFIARYRKEATSGLDEVIIKSIADVYEYSCNLLKRKEDVIRLIDEKDLLTDELKNNIMNCNRLVEVEDLYRPFKEKKKTKASDALALGLEGLAKIIMSFPLGKDPLSLADQYVCEKEKDKNKKLMGAFYIIAEFISDNAFYRKWIRDYTLNTGVIKTKVKKNANDENKVYEMYYDYEEKVRSIKPHRVLAINRGEDLKVLNVSIVINEEKVLSFLENRIIKNDKSLVCDFVKEVIKDSYKRLIFPSIEREVRAYLTSIGEERGIFNFAKNVANLLMTPPVKDVNVMGFDPAFRTGCKLACLDKQGNVLCIDKIYPHQPVNDTLVSKKKVLSLIEKYKIDVIAIGNGTASRESEFFVADLLKESIYPCKYIIVSEAGASIYSASKLAISEFPSLDVSERSAISIGRRLLDPLSELVKIDPKGIGVGLYQHDLPSKELDKSLNFEVSAIVNKVGVNINTASASILSYISGLSKSVIGKLLSAREKTGSFKSRLELKKLSFVSSKVYEQAIGFIRINNGSNPLDKTNIHPESYDKATLLLEMANSSFDDLGSDKLCESLDGLDLVAVKEKLNIDSYTLDDIIMSLKRPLLDPRDEISKPILRSDVLSIDDLTEGIALRGTVRNVIDFGAFVDIGLHDDGLLHISEIGDTFIEHPSDVLAVGDVIDCYVKSIDKEKGRIALTMKRY